MTAAAPCGPVVYRFYDDADRLIYVGSTSNLSKRQIHHRCCMAWWADVARVEYDVHADIAEARDAEREQIAELRPVHNRLHNPDWEWSYDRQAWVPAGTPGDPDAKSGQLFRRAVARSARKGLLGKAQAAAAIAASRSRTAS